MTAVAVRAIIEQRTDAEFHWKAHALAVKADVAAAELKKVYQQFGAVTPDAVVRAASEPDSPLHPAFEWDDTEAARAYREQQARLMLRMLVVTYRKPDSDERTKPTRYYVKLLHTNDDDAGDGLSDEEELATTPKVYLPVNRVMDSEELRRRYIRQAFREATAWKQRYADIREFARVFDAIEAVARDLGYGA